MTRMAGPDCAGKCNLVYIHTNIRTYFTAGILIPHASPSLQTAGGACEHPTAPSFRRRAGNRLDTGGMRKKCRKERVGSVAANPDNLLIGSNKEAEGGPQGTRGSSNNCTSRESASPLSRLIRGFRNKYE